VSLEAGESEGALVLGKERAASPAEELPDSRESSHCGDGQSSDQLEQGAPPTSFRHSWWLGFFCDRVERLGVPARSTGDLVLDSVDRLSVRVGPLVRSLRSCLLSLPIRERPVNIPLVHSPRRTTVLVSVFREQETEEFAQSAHRLAGEANRLGNTQRDRGDWFSISCIHREFLQQFRELSR
jgi:hypothetical protein